MNDKNQQQQIRKTPSARKGWDPGAPRAVKPLGASLYLVESFREDGLSYLVNLSEGTCNCPYFQKKLLPDAEMSGVLPSECKHLQLVKAYAARPALSRPRPVLTYEVMQLLLKQKDLPDLLRFPLLVLLSYLIEIERQFIHDPLDGLEGLMTELSRRYREFKDQEGGDGNG